MFIQPIDYFLAVWFALAAGSALYVGVDQYRNNPEPVVMKWGFILVTLYMGPLGLLLYVLSDKEPRPGEHEAFIRPLWKQGVGSTIHCVAGDATGIILAAVITEMIAEAPRDAEMSTMPGMAGGHRDAHGSDMKSQHGRESAHK